MNDPRKGYNQLQPGDHPGRFEAEAQLWREDPKLLAEYLDTDPLRGDSATVDVEATKPDARVNLRLTVGFVPSQGGAQDDLDYVCLDAATVRAHLADTEIWLAGCDAFSGGLRECENLIGTEATPVQMISDGLWGAIYEVDVDVKAVRARIDIAAPGVAGRFMVTAKWCAISPMSDRDWLHARERMQLVVKNPRTGLQIEGEPEA